MAKNGMRKKKTNQNGYFARNIRELGPDFLIKKTAKDIRFEYKFIFKDIANMAPEDIPQITKYFTNATFVYNLLLSANDEAARNNAAALGVNTYIQMNTMPDPSMRLNEFLVEFQQLAAAYSTISFYLNNILTTVNCCYDSVSAEASIEMNLKTMCIQISKFRRIL